MIKSDDVEELFVVLNEMTLATREDAVLPPSPRMRRLENWAMYGYIAMMAVLLLAVGIHREWPSLPYMVAVAEFSYLVLLFFGLAFLLSATFNVGFLFWRQRKQRFPALLALFRQDMRSDLDYVKKLEAFDKSVLDYGLLQYRHRWNVFDGRIGLLTGDLRKIGLFPALTAASMSASTLLKNGNNQYLWWPLILAACFYLVAFHAHGRRERPQQVIDLLEYAAGHAAAHIG